MSTNQEYVVEKVGVFTPKPVDINELKTLIKNHHKYTGSKIAKDILDNWEIELHKFTKVMPSDYKRVLQERSGKLKEANG